jgi:anti-anti-sigma factor
MDITEEHVGRVVVATARGRLDGTASQDFGARLDKLVAGAQPRVLVDFSGVDFVSSAGLRAVLFVLKKVKAAGGMLALCGVQAPVQEVLDITGLSGMIEVHPGRAEGIAALS